MSGRPMQPSHSPRPARPTCPCSSTPPPAQPGNVVVGDDPAGGWSAGRLGRYGGGLWGVPGTPRGTVALGYEYGGNHYSTNSYREYCSEKTPLSCSRSGSLSSKLDALTQLSVPLLLRPREGLRPEAVGGHLKHRLWQRDEPTHQDHPDQRFPFELQVSIPREGHKDIGDDE
jgi:hypothetical protein